MTIKGIHLRMGKLKELASKSVHGRKHEIYTEKTFNQKSDEEQLKDGYKKSSKNKNKSVLRATQINTAPNSTNQFHI